MAKPAPRRIPSDDCAVVVDGTTYYPHEDEWVEFVGTLTVGDLMALAQLERFGVELQAAEGDADQGIQTVRIMDRYFRQVCDGLARRVTAWSWTDDLGRPLPDPAGDPEAFAALRPAELTYLIGLARGEGAPDRAARKNGSRPSPITSSATASASMRAATSTTGLSRPRAS
jgi:hypothetical protein